MEAHGTFHTSHCIECRAEYSQEWIRGQSYVIPSVTKLML